jgi:hypothetical protein
MSNSPLPPVGPTDKEVHTLLLVSGAVGLVFALFQLWQVTRVKLLAPKTRGRESRPRAPRVMDGLPLPLLLLLLLLMRACRC